MTTYWLLGETQTVTNTKDETAPENDLDGTDAEQPRSKQATIASLKEPILLEAPLVVNTPKKVL